MTAASFCCAKQRRPSYSNTISKKNIYGLVLNVRFKQVPLFTLRFCKLPCSFVLCH